MDNNVRLIISIIAILVGFLLVSSGGSTGSVVSFLLMGVGIWSLIEGISFVKNKKNKDAMPLAITAILVAIYAIFLGFGEIMTSSLNLIEGGPFQSIGFFLVFITVLAFPILGIWALVKGFKLIKNKKKLKLGIWSIIIGLLLLIPGLLLLFGMFS